MLKKNKRKILLFADFLFPIYKANKIERNPAVCSIRFFMKVKVIFRMDRDIYRNIREYMQNDCSLMTHKLLKQRT